MKVTITIISYRVFIFSLLLIPNLLFAESIEDKVNRLLTPVKDKAILYLQFDPARGTRGKCKSEGCGHDMGPYVYLNDKEVYILHSNTYARLELDPGTYNLKIDWGWGHQNKDLIINDIQLNNGDVKKYRYSVKVLSTSSSIMMISPGVFMPIGHAETEPELIPIENIDQIITAMPNLKTQQEIEKIWNSWDEEPEF